MKFKQIAAVAALALTAVSASATPMVDLGGNTWSFGNFVTGTGTDTWTFDPIDGFTYDSIVATFSVGSSHAITGMTLDGNPFTQINSTWLYGAPVNDQVHTVLVDFGGTGSSTYNGAVLLQNPLAVPEPETTAMLLAGLGAVGLLSRRRKINAS